MSAAQRLQQARLSRFAALAQGGAESRLLSQDVLAAADAGISALADEALVDIAARVEALCAPEIRGDAAELFRLAHDIRGVAGTFGFVGVGSAADALCDYLDPSRGGQGVNVALIDLLTAAIAGALKNPRDQLVDDVAEACRSAVAASLAREGRGVALAGASS